MLLFISSAMFVAGCIDDNLSAEQIEDDQLTLSGSLDREELIHIAEEMQ